MRTNEQLRAELIAQTDIAFTELMRQLDFLFGQVVFYLDRYPMLTRSDEMRTNELNFCVKQLGDLPTQMCSVIKAWKQGIPSPISMSDMELDILNEFWANLQGLIYFLLSAEIDLEPFDVDASTKCFYVLNRANRVLT